MEDNAVFEKITKETYSDEFLTMLEQSNPLPKAGQVYECSYLKETEKEYLFDVGFKDYIRVKKSREEDNFMYGVEEGEQLKVGITQIEDRKDFSIYGSIADVKRIEVIETLETLKSSEFVSARIDSLNTAGYSATILLDKCEIDAFMPQQLAGVNKIKEEDREDLIGKILEVGVESFISEKGTWVISRKSFLEALIPIYIEELDLNTIYTGKVTGTAKFGVFVEFNTCLTGLIHKSSLNDKLKDDFRSLNIGDEVSFRVKDIQRPRKGKPKIILTQEEKSDIWNTISQNDIFTGTVKQNKDFGIMVNIGEDVMGLIRPENITDGIKELNQGDSIEVKVFWVDKDEQKIYLQPC